LLNFDLDKDDSLEDHVNNLIQAIRILNFRHEDVVYSLFPFTFDEKMTTWYFNLIVGSIPSWRKFEIDFITKFWVMRKLLYPLL